MRAIWYVIYQESFQKGEENADLLIALINLELWDSRKISSMTKYYI